MKESIAVVGCGHWGKNLIRNFYELGSLSTVCDSNTKLAESFAEQYSVNHCSFDEILSNKNINGIVLAVPAIQHSSLALMAMEAGKHVYVEKPIALHINEAKEMIACAKENKVQLMVGHLLQYHPVFIYLRELVNSKKFGPINYIYSNRLGFGKVRSEEDVIWSFAPHDISMIISLIGQNPKNVKTESACIIQPDIADIATIHLEFESKIKAHISVSWLHPYKEQKLVVVGDKMMAVFDDSLEWHKKLALYPHSFKIKDGSPYLQKSEVKYLDIPKSEPLRNECKHFLSVVSGNITPTTDGQEGLNVLNVLEAASGYKGHN